MGVVFINYRAKDHPLAAATIYGALAGRFGAAQVFRDCDSIQAGDHYPTELHNGIERADVLLAVIGPRWHRLTDERGALLIQRDDDWVRWEIARAIERKIRIVPVLLRDVPESVELLDRATLPESIRELANFQTFDISQRRLSADLDRLTTRLAEMIPSLAGPQAMTDIRHGNTKATRRRRNLAIMSVAAAVIVASALLVVTTLFNKPDHPQSPGAAGTTLSSTSGDEPATTSPSGGRDVVVWQGPITFANGSVIDVGHMPIEVGNLAGANVGYISFYFNEDDIQAGYDHSLSAWTGSSPPTSAECANQLRVQSVQKLVPRTGLTFCTSGQEVERIAYATITNYDLNSSTLDIQLVVWQQQMG